MKENKAYKPLKVQKKVLDIVRDCFEKENNGVIDARQIALDELGEFLIETGDGSFTFQSECLENSSETMHTFHCGLEEYLEKYAKPSHLIGRDNVHIMDICSGLGYTAAVCLEYLNDETINTAKNPNICIEMVEISPLTLAAGLIIPSPLKSHEIVKKAIEDHLFSIGFLKHRKIRTEIPPNIQLKLHIIDAREIVKNSLFKPSKDHSIENGSEQLDVGLGEQNKKFDAILLVPFSPGVSPELYSIDFLKGISPLLKNDGMLLTYTSSSAVRYTLIELGLYVGEGPSFNRSGGTLASPHKEYIEKPLISRDERMVALSDAGIPFRDTELDNSGFEINERRQNERAKARKEYKLASTVKSPVYLFKHIKEGRLRRRILKDFQKFGIEDLISEKSKFIVCPQYKECICGNECEYLDNSSERVIEMEKRLNIIVNNLK